MNAVEDIVLIWGARWRNLPVDMLHQTDRRIGDSGPRFQYLEPTTETKKLNRVAERALAL